MRNGLVPLGLNIEIMFQSWGMILEIRSSLGIIVRSKSNILNGR